MEVGAVRAAAATPSGPVVPERGTLGAVKAFYARLCLAASVAAAGCLGGSGGAASSSELEMPFAAGPGFNVLVFTRTAGFRHDSISDGVAAIRALGDRAGFEVDWTEDATAFTDENLSRYTAVIFLSTTGDILAGDEERVFERFVRAGHGYVGIHAAADTEYGWPWYGGLVGAYFRIHPEIQPAIVLVEDPSHPSTAVLPVAWPRTDEWYDFQTNPRGSASILLTLDEASYAGGTMGEDHPIAWYHAYDGGRAWYTAGGHTSESFEEPLFLHHLLGGILYAAGVEPWPDGQEPLPGSGSD